MKLGSGKEEKIEWPPCGFSPCSLPSTPPNLTSQPSPTYTLSKEDINTLCLLALTPGPHPEGLSLSSANIPEELFKDNLSL